MAEFVRCSRNALRMPSSTTTKKVCGAERLKLREFQSSASVLEQHTKLLEVRACSPMAEAHALGA